MTRELLFYTTFESQLAAFTGWKSLVSVQGGALSPSDYPGFEVLPGEAKYTAFDSLGFAVHGEQSFTVRVLFSHPELSTLPMRGTHSEFVGLIEGFFAAGYVPPVVGTGDQARIDGIRLQSIEPAVLNKMATRSAFAVHAAYDFTLF